jgi:hypothetical protein
MHLLTATLKQGAERLAAARGQGVGRQEELRHTIVERNGSDFIFSGEAGTNSRHRRLACCWSTLLSPEIFMKQTLLAALALALGCGSAHAAEQADSKVIFITYSNLTAGQAFSPAVFFSHNAMAPQLFAEGQPASFALQRLAEEGNTGPLLLKITKILGGAYQHVASPVSVQPGKRRTVAVRVTAEHPFISGAFMLAMTNDGFTGIESIDAWALEKPRTLELFAWDAGTENNNERGDYLIVMEGTQRDPENALIRRHEGLRGDADAPGFWKFDPARPVASVTIRPAPELP